MGHTKQSKTYVATCIYTPKGHKLSLIMKGCRESIEINQVPLKSFLNRIHFILLNNALLMIPTITPLFSNQLSHFALIAELLNPIIIGNGEKSWTQSLER